MNQVTDEVLKVAEGIAPEAPIVEAVAAVAETVANPSPSNIINDVELAVRLVKQMKAKLTNAHPTVWDIVKSLL